MSFEGLNSKLEPKKPASTNTTWEKISSGLSNLDSNEKLGAFMGGIVSPPVLASPSKASKMNEMIPEEVTIAGADINTHQLMEDVYEFKDEWLIGLESEADNPLQAATLSIDKLGHYSVGYLGGGLAARGVDKITEEYDPKKVALGGALAVTTYAIAKEGWYEGGSGIQFDLESMDVWGDWTMDTVGMLHSIYNHHKRKTVEEGEEPKGVVGQLANKAGKVYGRTLSQNNSQTGNNNIYLDQEDSNYLEDSHEEILGSSSAENKSMNASNKKQSDKKGIYTKDSESSFLNTEKSSNIPIETSNNSYAFQISNKISNISESLSTGVETFSEYTSNSWEKMKSNLSSNIKDDRSNNYQDLTETRSMAEVYN